MNKITFVILGILLLAGAYVFLQTFSGGTIANSSRTIDCSLLGPVQKIECERTKAFPEATKKMTSFFALSDTAKLAFDCASLGDPVAITECDGNKKYIQLSAELQKGNIGYCDTAFASATYGARAAEYQNECRIMYVLDFTAAKDCSILKEKTLVDACTKAKMITQPPSISRSDLMTDTTLAKALANNDSGLCGTDSACRDSYYYEMGKKNIDNALCLNIAAKGVRVACEYSVSLAQAVAHKDASYCANIEQEEMAAACQKEFASGRY